MSDLIGKTIGQYEIVEKIGVGGMATVFKAYQRSINRHVAVKILPTQFAHDPNFVKRFTQEARAIAALEHPHILPVYDFGTEADLPYMVMRYVEGGTLADLMGQPMPDERVVKIIGDVGRALEYAHSQGVVHRDIKPSNVLIDHHGEVLLTDFGIAKMMQDSGEGTGGLTGTGSILGTPEYMSPEQAEGVSVDHRSDIYSLGVVMYELLTGQPPYRAQTPLAVVLKHVKEPLSPPRTINPNVPEPLEQVVVKAMAKNRNERYQTAAEMEQALREALKEIERTAETTSIPAPKTQGLAAPKPAPIPVKSSRGMMGPLLIVGGLAAVILCVGAIAIFAFLAASGDGSGESSTAVSGDITVAEDIVKATEVVEPTTESSETPTAPGADVGIELPVVEPEGEVLLNEPFDSNQNDWTIGNEDDEYGLFNAEIVDGRYRLTETAKQGVFAWEQLADANFDNFLMVVDAIPIEANTDDYGYGLTFRNSPDYKSLYTFEIDEDGFLVSLLDDGDWYTLVDYTPLPAINVDGPNRLMVKAAGPALTFFINGEEAARIEDDSLFEGSIGVALELYEAGDKATVEFDNLMVYALSDEELAGISNVLFADSFDSDANGWSTGEFDSEYSQDEITIEEGKYIFNVTSKAAAFVEKTLPNRTFSDFVLTVEATPRDTADHYSYGVAFREASNGDTYTLEIGNDGLYAIFLFSGEWQRLKDWSSSSAIKPGQTNEIKVIAEADTFTFFVNGQELTTVQDDTLSEGKIGLLVDMFEEGQSTTVEFDNLVIERVRK